MTKYINKNRTIIDKFKNSKKASLFFAFFMIVNIIILGSFILLFFIMGNIEQLKKEVNDIKDSLKALKNNVSISDSEKKNKANELKNQANETKHKIQKEIDSLTNKTDNESKKKKEEAEALLNSFNEITTLYTSVIDATKTNDTHEQQQTQTETGTTDDSKSKGWLGEQWDKVKQSPRKYILGATGLVAAGVAIKKAWNRAFGKKDDEEGEDEESEETSDKKEDKKEGKKSFWGTTWGKILKWTGITTVAGGGVYGLSKWIGGKKDNTGSTSSEKLDNQRETAQKGGDKISDGMLDQLLKMEGSQNFVAHKMPQFGENFVTGPYGMVYKHIDANGNLLKSPASFKDGERVTETWAKNNARAYYDKCAKGRKKSLDEKGLSYNQNELDSLVSASGGTAASKKKLESYVFSHWSDKNSIFNFMSSFATTAAGNGKVMPGLVSRRKFEANWFIGNKQPFSTYQKRRK